MEKHQWPFESPPDTAVFTSKKIVSENEWIYYVSHDVEDGAWQFHPYGFTSMSDSAVVGLGTMCEIDPSIIQLYDLPEGWYAWRSSPQEKLNWCHSAEVKLVPFSRNS